LQGAATAIVDQYSARVHRINTRLQTQQYDIER
jgi:hypothetical protein